MRDNLHAMLFLLIVYTRSSPVFHDILDVRQNFPVICKNGSINVTLEGLHNTVADFYVSEIISRGQPQVLRTKYTKVMNCIPINYFEWIERVLLLNNFNLGFSGEARGLALRQYPQANDLARPCTQIYDQRLYTEAF